VKVSFCPALKMRVIVTLAPDDDPSPTPLPLRDERRRASCRCVKASCRCVKANADRWRCVYSKLNGRAHLMLILQLICSHEVVNFEIKRHFPKILWPRTGSRKMVRLTNHNLNQRVGSGGKKEEDRRRSWRQLLIKHKVFLNELSLTHTQGHMYDQHARGIATTRHRSLIGRGGKKGFWLETKA